MKNLRLFFAYYPKIFSLVLLFLLINITVEASSPGDFSNFYKFQQTKRIVTTKKKKKIIVKKVIVKKKLKTTEPGIWGGDGIGFTIGASGVSIEYDCAEGEIKQKFVTDEKGNFNLNGFHKFEAMGAIRVGFTPKPQAANFQGEISGDTMKLKVVLTETNQIVGEFTLVRGDAPRIRKCR